MKIRGRRVLVKDIYLFREIDRLAATAAGGKLVFNSYLCQFICAKLHQDRLPQTNSTRHAI